MPRNYKKKPRYKLLYGKHAMRKDDGSFWKFVRAGTLDDVVTSEFVNLEEAFPGKFRKLSEEEEQETPRRGRKKQKDTVPTARVQEEDPSDTSKSEPAASDESEEET